MSVFGHWRTLAQCPVWMAPVWMAPFLQVLFDVAACLGLVLSCVRPVNVALPLAIMVSAN